MACLRELFEVQLRWKKTSLSSSLLAADRHLTCQQAIYCLWRLREVARIPQKQQQKHSLILVTVGVTAQPNRCVDGWPLPVGPGKRESRSSELPSHSFEAGLSWYRGRVCSSCCKSPMSARRIMPLDIAGSRAYSESSWRAIPSYRR